MQEPKLQTELEGREGFSTYYKTYALVIALFLVAILFMPKEAESYNALSLIPAAFLLLFIFYTKRILEALALGAMLGYAMKYGMGFFEPFSGELLNIMMNESIAWLIVVCGLMGSIIALIEKSGGAYAFGELVSKKAKTRKNTLLWTWVLGLAIFIDDYLNCLTIGSAMTRVTDKHKVSREYLAYVVDSTAAPTCVLVPISTWALFIGVLMVENGLGESGAEVAQFIKTIPYNFYAWAAVLIVPLVILGIIPIIGPMKAAEKRAQETGVMAPPGSEKIDMKAGEVVEVPENPNIWFFFLPILVLVGVTVYTELNLQMGVLATLAFIFVYYLAKKVITPLDYADMVILGIKNMLFPLSLVVLAYWFAAASEELGFVSYMIEIGERFMTPQLLPLVIFIIFGLTEFIMGISWGMYIIALPIVIPLAISLGANPYLAVGAVASAGIWGSHICFYSDATILSSAATGCENFRHAITQLPYGLIGFVIAAIAFIIAGNIVV
jgi:tetracycline resistance efflux pump